VVKAALLTEGVPLFNTLVWDESLNSRIRHLISINQNHRCIVRLKYISISWTV